VIQVHSPKKLRWLSLCQQFVGCTKYDGGWLTARFSVLSADNALVRVDMMKTRSAASLSRRALLGAMLLCVVAATVRADDDEINEIPGHDEASEHEYALDLVKTGQALPLAEILLDVQKKVPGDLLEARLKKRRGILVYILTVLSKNGTYSIVTVNAKDKTIIRVQEK
jgi:uncharacterized membrane protein YkoI